MSKKWQALEEAMEMEEAYKRIMYEIQQEYEAGEISYIDAIEQLQKWCKLSTVSADATVSDWEVDE